MESSERESGDVQDNTSAEPVYLVDDANLEVVSSQPTLREYLKAIKKRSPFVVADARARAFGEAHGMFMGRLWLVVQPLSEFFMYWFIFGVVLKTGRGIDNFVGYLVLGIVFFQVFGKQMMQGNLLLRSRRGLIDSFQLPNASVVLSTSLRIFFDSLPSVVIAVAAALLTQIGEPVSWRLVAVIPLLILLHLFGLGAMFMSARFTAHLPDLKVIFQLMNRALFYLSGIFYSVERFVDSPALYDLMSANPIYQFLTAIRGIVLANELPSVETWVYVSSWTLAMLLVGFLFFWRGESRYVGQH